MELSEYDINSGEIYTKLRRFEKFKEINHLFIEETIHSAYINLLTNKQVITKRYKEEDDEYFENYSGRYETEAELKFPVSRYFLWTIGTDKRKSIINFEEACMVTQMDENFDLFFALKIFVSDPFQIDNLLKYQFKETFKNDYNVFYDFLEKLLLKYKQFLNGYIEIVKRGLDHFEIKGTSQNRKQINLKLNKDDYTQKQIAVAYAFMKIHIDSKNALKILEKHSQTRNVPKFLTRRINHINELTKLSGNKTADTKHLKVLERAKQLIIGMKKQSKNENAIPDIDHVISAFQTNFDNKY